MTQTWFEQGTVSVQARPAMPGSGLDQGQAAWLVEAGERINARIATWDTPARLRVNHFVGGARFGDLQVEILPKLDSLQDPVTARRCLLAMLAETQELELKPSEAAQFLESDQPVIAALARLYCRRLLDALRRGLRQEYVVCEEELPRVRGRIDWAAQVRLQMRARPEFPCVFDDRSEDTPLNRTLKAALVRASTMATGGRIASTVTELRHAMADVGAPCLAGEALSRLRTDRMSRHLEPLLTLAKLILGNRNPDLGRATAKDERTYALVWDMNVLFEEYVGRLAEQTLGGAGFRVDLQSGSTYLAEDATRKRSAFLLRPDILVRRGRDVVLIADTKWKLLDPADPNLGVSSGDMYQMLAYATRLGSASAALIYPHHTLLGIPGLQRQFRLSPGSGTDCYVSVFTVDVSKPAGTRVQIAGLLERVAA